LVIRYILLFVLVTDILNSCSYTPDIDEIRKRGKLIAVTDYNSINYFIYKGETMGFHFELLKSFSDYIGVDLEIKTENDINNALEMLEAGTVDIMAIGLTVNSSRKRKIHFTEPFYETREVLVQRKPVNWRSISVDSTDKMLIRNHLDLDNKTIYVQSGSSYVQRLKELEGEIEGKIIY
jgi:membrane-bound lytic murein transglycosylase F